MLIIGAYPKSSAAVLCYIAYPFVPKFLGKLHDRFIFRRPEIFIEYDNAGVCTKIVISFIVYGDGVYKNIGNSRGIIRSGKKAVYYMYHTIAAGGRPHVSLIVKTDSAGRSGAFAVNRVPVSVGINISESVLSRYPDIAVFVLRNPVAGHYFAG